MSDHRIAINWSEQISRRAIIYVAVAGSVLFSMQSAAYKVIISSAMSL